MKTAIFSVGLVLFASGCATTPKGRAAELVVVTDGVADQLAAKWEPFVDDQIDHCRSTLGDDVTEEQRAECMGIAGKGKETLEVAIQTLITVQIGIKEGVKCEELKTCPKEINWEELLAEIGKAWNDLKPFVAAIGGK